MRCRIFILFCVFFSGLAISDPKKVVVTASIMSTRDNRTLASFVKIGNKVRLYPKIAVRALDASNNGLKGWMARRLPARLMGRLVRTDKTSGLKVWFRPITLYRSKDSLYCTRADSQDLDWCEMQYVVSKKNAVDIDPGGSGYHEVGLKIISPWNFNARVVQGASHKYYVNHSRPRLSSFAFAGLPQH